MESLVKKILCQQCVFIKPPNLELTIVLGSKSSKIEIIQTFIHLTIGERIDNKIYSVTKHVKTCESALFKTSGLSTTTLSNHSEHRATTLKDIHMWTIKMSSSEPSTSNPMTTLGFSPSTKNATKTFQDGSTNGGTGLDHQIKFIHQRLSRLLSLTTRNKYLTNQWDQLPRSLSTLT
ncbi:hypothetical protein Bca101_027007 [Brassica carinata]